MIRPAIPSASGPRRFRFYLHPSFLSLLLLAAILAPAACNSGGDGNPTPTPTPTPGETFDANYACSTSTGRAPLYKGKVVAWGDLHSHTTYSNDALDKEGCTLIPAQAIANARDISRLNFVAVTDHAENEAPGYYTQAKWDDLIAQERAATGIVVFPAFEYTKTVRPRESNAGNGHKCIILHDFDHLPPRGYGYDQYSLPTRLWEWLNTTAAAGRFICIPHHPSKGADYDNRFISMETDWDVPYVDAGLMPVVEIYSRHGSSEMPGCEEPVNQFYNDGSVQSALNRWLADRNPAYKLGIIGSTDTHFANPGWIGEEAGNVDERLGHWTGGLAGVWVTAADRDSIWNAIKAKDCYGTSGGRLELEFTIKCDGQVAPMGGTLKHATAFSAAAPGQVYLHLWLHNPDGQRIVRVQIFRSGELVADRSDPAWGAEVHLHQADPLDTDFAYYRVKVWQAKAVNPLEANVAEERSWSSPIWIERQS